MNLYHGSPTANIAYLKPMNERVNANSLDLGKKVWTTHDPRYAIYQSFAKLVFDKAAINGFVEAVDTFTPHFGGGVALVCAQKNQHLLNEPCSIYFIGESEVKSRPNVKTHDYDSIAFSVEVPVQQELKFESYLAAIQYFEGQVLSYEVLSKYNGFLKKMSGGATERESDLFNDRYRSFYDGEPIRSELPRNDRSERCQLSPASSVLEMTLSPSLRRYH